MPRKRAGLPYNGPDSHQLRASWEKCSGSSGPCKHQGRASGSRGWGCKEVAPGQAGGSQWMEAGLHLRAEGGRCWDILERLLSKSQTDLVFSCHCVTSGKSLSLSEPQSSHLRNAGIICPSPQLPQGLANCKIRHTCRLFTFLWVRDFSISCLCSIF